VDSRAPPGSADPVKRLGLIVNPVAGIGGRTGLKGSDGARIQQRAFQLGAVPEASNRAIQALERIVRVQETLELITYPEEMGEEAARACGFSPTIIGAIQAGQTTPRDTQNAAREMERLNVDLLLFAGGDGTARDIYTAIEARIPVLGIPAGVKIHSAVFATTPRSAGDLATLFLQGRASRLREAEVLDVDEDAFRQGIVAAQLYGYLKIPYQRRLVQGQKAGSRPGEKAALVAIAHDIVENMVQDCLYIIGPGTTTRAITTALGLEKTLIGVDVVLNGELVAVDVNESRLLELLDGRPARIIVTPIGGQGCIFGRGNQQLSPQVIKKVGQDNIIVVSTPEKLHALTGQPLWVDTGDPAVDRMLGGYTKIITGFRERTVYRVAT
jgi:predicted polyphosphate/ATP-dependent NAD kinase